MEHSAEYANFRAWVPRRVLPVGSAAPQDLVFYEWGPRAHVEPLLCLHGVIGSADAFFPQVLRLAAAGYRVIAAELPVAWTAAASADALHTLLDMLRVRRVHVYGAGLGGFVALHLAARRPDRVASLALTHAFADSDAVRHRLVYSPSVLRWLPDFLVRAAVQSLCPRGRAEPRAADAAAFAVARTMAASRDALASRLAVLVTKASVRARVRVPEARITLVDVHDLARGKAAPLRAEATKAALPAARTAWIKGGGDFPYLAAPDDVAMHLVVHLRRHAPPPAVPLPTPPPATPRPAAEGESSPIMSGADEGEGEELRRRAEERVVRWEGERVGACEEIVALREAAGGNGMEDAALCAVLEDCSGDVVLAVRRLEDSYYADGFYDERRLGALEDAVRDLQAEDAPGRGEVEAEVEEGGGEEDGRGVGVDGEGGGGLEEHGDADEGGDGDADRASESAHPLSGSVPVLVGPVVAGGGVVVQQDQVRAAPEEESAPVPLGAPGPSDEDQRSDTSGEHMFTRGNSRKKVIGEELRPSKDRYQPETRYPPETDSVSAYVTSKRVGMRNEGSIIGRGPTPLNTPLFTASGGGSPMPHPAATLSLARGHPAEKGADAPPRADLWAGGLAVSRGVDPMSRDAFDRDELGRDALGRDELGRGDPDDMMLGVRGRTMSQRSASMDPPATMGVFGMGAGVGRNESFDTPLGDGWDDFRLRDQREEAVSPPDSAPQSVSAEPSPVKPAKPVKQPKTPVAPVQAPPAAQEPPADEEGDRLREWVMSAQSATESVRRKAERS